jgi:hypothetical protein
VGRNVASDSHEVAFSSSRQVAAFDAFHFRLTQKDASVCVLQSERAPNAREHAAASENCCSRTARSAPLAHANNRSHVVSNTAWQ